MYFLETRCRIGIVYFTEFSGPSIGLWDRSPSVIFGVALRAASRRDAPCWRGCWIGWMSVAFHPATASCEVFFSASFDSPRCSVPVTAVGGVNRVPFGVRVRFLFVDPRSYNSDHSSFSAARLSASKDMSVAIGACSWTRGCVVQHGAKRRAMWRAIGAMIVACLASNNVIILTIDVRLLDEGRASRWAARRMWKLRAPTLWIPTVQSAGRTFSASTFIFRLFQIYIYIRKCMCTLKRYRCEFNMRCFTILTCCRC